MPLPVAKFTPDARRDLGHLLDFIAMQPWGKPLDREREIYAAFESIQRAPLARPVRGRLQGTNIGLRQYFVAQFVIAYAYFEPSAEFPDGLVSIRGIRHHRNRDTLFGVRESGADDVRQPLQTRDASSPTCHRES